MPQPRLLSAMTSFVNAGAPAIAVGALPAPQQYGAPAAVSAQAPDVPTAMEVKTWPPGTSCGAVACGKPVHRSPQQYAAPAGVSAQVVMWPVLMSENTVSVVETDVMGTFFASLLQAARSTTRPNTV